MDESLGYTRLPKGSWGHLDMPERKLDEGYLKRGGHRIYWSEYGNPSGEPVVYLHGGPGSPPAAGLTKIFDPEKYKVLVFHQRGCGKSEPNVADDLHTGLRDNTTAELVADIDALCDARGFKNTHLYGGSWGSTLGVAYAVAHPERVRSLTLRGVFPCAERDLHYFYQGNAADYDPAYPHAHAELEGAYRAYLGDGTAAGSIPLHERTNGMAQAYEDAWRDYVTMIPKEERGDMIAAYRKRLYPETGPSDFNAARAWARWEGITGFLRHEVSPEALASYDDPRNVLPFSAIENHYFYNILRHTMPGHVDMLDPEVLKPIAHLPIRIVHGRYDQVCGLFGAEAFVHALKQAGGNPEFVVTEMGHGFSERDTIAQLMAWFDGPLERTPKSPVDHARRDKNTSAQR